MLDSDIIWRPAEASASKIVNILACCNVKDKTQLQITHNIDTQNYLIAKIAIDFYYFIGSKISEHNEKVMVSSQNLMMLGQIVHPLMGLLKLQ